MRYYIKDTRPLYRTDRYSFQPGLYMMKAWRYNGIYRSYFLTGAQDTQAKGQSSAE